MDAKKNATYIRWVAKSVREFREALEDFMELHVPNLELARGTAPAVFPRDTASQTAIHEATSRVSEAAGRAMEGPHLASCMITVEGYGKVNPVAIWHTITLPKPVLEYADIHNSCSMTIGRLDAMAHIAAAEAPPEMGVSTMHPLIWNAAKNLWRDEHYRHAVGNAAAVLMSHVKSTIQRNDIQESHLWTEALSSEPPTPGKPRLRWPGDPKDLNVSTMNNGLRRFAPGVQATIRNPAAHVTEDMSAQDALERLAALSLLARWVEACELITFADPASEENAA